MVQQKDIDELLSRWDDAKRELAKQEAICEKYKIYVEKLMNSSKTDELSGTDFTAKRAHAVRYNVNGKSLPEEIFEKYKTKVQYTTMNLRRNK